MFGSFLISLVGAVLSPFKGISGQGSGAVKSFAGASKSTVPSIIPKIDLPKLSAPFFSIIAPSMASIVNSTGIENQALQNARSILIAREGRRNDVYIDSEGYPTVGIGHKVLPQDNLRVGHRISDQQIEAFFAADIKTAFEAAKRQARESGKYNPDFIAALTSVNFQLGTGWTRTFSNTWARIVRGDVKGAVSALKVSKWNKQTPTRVADFVSALERNFA